jgi:hypothetical protein
MRIKKITVAIQGNRGDVAKQCPGIFPKIVGQTAMTKQLCNIPESAFQICRNTVSTVSMLGECILKVIDSSSL